MLYQEALQNHLLHGRKIVREGRVLRIGVKHHVVEEFITTPATEEEEEKQEWTPVHPDTLREFHELDRWVHVEETTDE